MMTRIKSKIFSLFILTFFVCTSQSPADGLSGFITFAHPGGEFKNNIETNGWGLGALYTFKLGKSPFSLGVDLGYLTYGSDERTGDYVFEYEGVTYNIPDLKITVVNSHRIFQGLLFLRFQPIKKGTIRPYIDVMAGLNKLYTVTDIDYGGIDYNFTYTYYDPVYDEWGEVDLSDSEVSFRDTVLNYGLGVGLKIRLGEITFLDLRVRYLFGGKAEYLKDGAIVIDGSDVSFISTKSKTDLLTFQIGISL